MLHELFFTRPAPSYTPSPVCATIRETGLLEAGIVTPLIRQELRSQFGRGHPASTAVYLFSSLRNNSGIGPLEYRNLYSRYLVAPGEAWGRRMRCKDTL